ncbi:MAG: hypothetical protein FWG25_01480 [Promicromonosporaceae bacterium]|nr:hypothetical protein [Promicromonosporaceae bacterium]
MRYEINLNGRVFVVDVDRQRAQIDGVQEGGSAGAVPPNPPPAAPPPTPPAAPQGELLPAPMPGVIKDVRVQVGSQVQAGQPMLILEAMKMENEIVSPRAATVTEILVGRGQSVQAGAPLLRLA